MIRPLPLLVLLFSVLFPLAGYLVPFDGYDAGQVPIPQPDPPGQPAGWAFSVWGLIYVALLASAAFGVVGRNADPDWDRVRLPLLGTLALGTAWLPIATVSAIWATVVILVMAGLAVAALLRAPARRDRAWLQLPVALLAGWLTAAAFVSLGSTGAGWGWLLGPLGWAYLCVALALVVGVAVLRLKPAAPEYALTVAWALFGIAAKNGMAEPGLTALAVAGIAALAAVAWVGARRAA